MKTNKAAHCAALFVDGLTGILPMSRIPAGASIALAVIVGLDWVHASSRDCLLLRPVLCQAA
ncbi:hypothetical protein [Xanthomonas arboricola]|uniref:hypothetical protein n=1 Tax=Xanthomonas arboricola TaxID=56448 RepID=UPI00141A748A|nr:hypothetical protein [Xanthomonas arboricola]NIK50209.1 hypothetical protein [Xanthomonas arboricola]